MNSFCEFLQLQLQSVANSFVYSKVQIFLLITQIPVSASQQNRKAFRAKFSFCEVLIKKQKFTMLHSTRSSLRKLVKWSSDWDAIYHNKIWSSRPLTRPMRFSTLTYLSNICHRFAFTEHARSHIFCPSSQEAIAERRWAINQFINMKNDINRRHRSNICSVWRNMGTGQDAKLRFFSISFIAIQPVVEVARTLI